MNDKVFVKESYKILKGTAVFKDGSIDEVKNVQVYSKINVDPWVEELENEIERLKYALKQRTAQSDANANLWMKELKRGAKQEKEIEQLRKENAKLKCLALHLFSKLFVYMNIHYHTLFKDALNDEYDFNQIACASITYKRKCEKTNELLIKYDEAYRKAKAKLRSSNG